MKKKRIILAISTLILLFVIGIAFYTRVEGWRSVDAFYFTGVTITTIGYGDIAPKTDIGKIFTVFFALMGVSLTLFILATLAEHYFSREHVLINKVEEQITNVKELQRRWRWEYLGLEDKEEKKGDKK